MEGSFKLKIIKIGNKHVLCPMNDDSVVVFKSYLKEAFQRRGNLFAWVAFLTWYIDYINLYYLARNNSASYLQSKRKTMLHVLSWDLYLKPLKLGRFYIWLIGASLCFTVEWPVMVLYIFYCNITICLLTVSKLKFR